MRVFFVRHAQSTMNTQKHLICGQLNHIQLSQEGKEQAKKLGEHFAPIRFHAIYSSSAVRAIQTATAIAKQSQFPTQELHTTDLLLERSQGDWSNQVRAEKYTPQVMATFFAKNGQFAAPNGESDEEVSNRMLSFLTFISQNHLSHETLLVVSHGMAIKDMLWKVLQKPRT